MVLSEQQSRLLSNYYGWLQQQGVCVVPASPDADAQERLQQLGDGFSMNLNLAEKYAAHFRCDERELVQNFRDRCADLSRTRHIKLFVPASAVAASIAESFRDAGIGKFYILVEDLSCSNGSLGSHSSPYVLGHIVEYEDAQGMRCIDLCNHATVLVTDMFLMGGSDKEGKAHTAGHFGEGMKVQINRLMVDRKLSVTYTTGNRLWSFSHKSQTHCSKPSLHLHSNCLRQAHGHPCADPNRPEETICSIRGTTALLSPMEVKQYLFLQQPQSLVETPTLPSELSGIQGLQGLHKWYPCVRVQDPAGDFGLEFLFDPQYHSKLYIHGILLKDMTPAPGVLRPLHHMGINYTGSTQLLLKYDLNRDRSSADVESLLCELVPRAVAMMSQYGTPCVDDQLLCVLSHLYLELSTDRTIFGRWRYSYLPPSRSAFNKAQQDLHLTAQLLGTRLGPSKGLPASSNPPLFPCKEKASNHKAEIQLLGYQPVEASDLLLSLWHDTGVLPSLDQLWLERRKEVDLMPDHMATWSEAARQEGEKMLNTIASLLVNMGSQIGIQPTAAAWRGIFKVLKLRTHLCYHDHVVIPFKADKASGCGPLLVFEAEYFLSRESVHKRMKANGDSCPGVNGTCDGNCLLQLIFQGTLEALQKLGMNGQQLQKVVMNKMLALTGSKVESLGAQAPEAPPIIRDASMECGRSSDTSDKSSSTKQTVQADVRFVQAPQVGEGKCSNFDTAAAIDSSVADSLFPKQATPAPKEVKGNTAAHPGSASEPLEFEVDCSSEQNLVVSKVELKPGRYLYIAEGTTPTPEVAALAQQLFTSIELLLQHVFVVGCEGPPPQFFVYYDPNRSSIAFNRAGQLWFNAAVEVDVSGYKNAAYGFGRFWFLVVCHELAHNRVKQHNSRSADACSAITLEYADRFKAFAHSFCGSCY